jgi:hypothetical protein
VADEAKPQLDINIKRRTLPAEVMQLRLESAAYDARNQKVAQPRIEANLAACKIVLQQMEIWHRAVAEETDLDLIGYSRASATWLLSGRLLGLLRALLVQVEAGIDNEAVITGRAIHEASQILLAFGSGEADDLIHLWLEDEGKYRYVKQKPASDAHDRFADKLNEAMERKGLPPLRSAREATETLYDLMSRTAHSRRSSCISSVWVEGRQMAYGIHPSPFRRAASAEWAASMTVAVTNAVGDALTAFNGRGFFSREVAPLQQSIEAVRQSSPLDEDSIRQAAGTD